MERGELALCVFREEILYPLDRMSLQISLMLLQFGPVLVLHRQVGHEVLIERLPPAQGFPFLGNHIALRIKRSHNSPNSFALLISTARSHTKKRVPALTRSFSPASFSNLSIAADSFAMVAASVVVA